jgi:Haem-binding domain
MKELVKRILLAVCVVAAGMQLVPSTTNPGCVTCSRAHMVDAASPQLGAILDRSCQDCHSANTRWPWYSRVAPISWMVARDVQRGRAKFDFSDWARRPHSGNERMEICDAVSNGSMPMRIYLLLHRDAQLNSQDVDLICEWAAAPDTSAFARPSRPSQAGEN